MKNLGKLKGRQREMAIAMGHGMRVSGERHRAEVGRKQRQTQRIWPCGFARLLLAGTMISGAALLMPTIGHAEGAQPGEVAQSSGAMVQFDIPAQSLDRALTSFADQANVKLFFPSAGLGNAKAPALTGRFTRDQALQNLLAGSGYGWRVSGENTVTIEKIPSGQGSNADGTVTLDPVRVEAQQTTAPGGDVVKGYVAQKTSVGTKTDTPILEIPKSVSVVTRDEMDDRGASSIFDATQYAPGVFGQVYGSDPRGYETFYMRGFDNYETGEFRDGLHVTGANQALYAAEAYGMESVDILKGSNNTLYGQSNIGGIVNSVTKRPRADQKQEIRLEYGDWNRAEGAFDIGGKATEDGNVLFRLVGLGSDGDYEYDFANGDELGNRRVYIAPSVTIGANDDTTLTLIADFTRDRRSGNYTFVDSNGHNYGFVPGEPGWEFYDNDQFSIGTDLEHKINDVWKLTQKTRYTSINVHAGGVFGYSMTGNTINRYIGITENFAQGVVMDNQAEATFSTGAVDHKLLFGVDGEYETNDFKYGYDYSVPGINAYNPVISGINSYDGTFTADYDFLQTNTQYGFYGQDQLTIADNWILTGGARYSRIHRDTDYRQASKADEERTDDAVTTDLGLTYVFDNGVAPYVSYGEGFNVASGVAYGGGTLDPEKSHQYEAGVKYQPNGTNALFTAAVYQLTKTNAIASDPDHSGFSVQTGEVRSRGIELEAKANLMAGLDMTASYAFNHTEITADPNGNVGNDAMNAPRNLASLWLQYTFAGGALDGLKLGSGVRYTSGYYADNANSIDIDGRTLLDAAISYQLDENWSFGVNASNLTDEEYTTTCSSSRCYVGDGRRVEAHMTYNW